MGQCSCRGARMKVVRGARRKAASASADAKLSLRDLCEAAERIRPDGAAALGIALRAAGLSDIVGESVLINGSMLIGWYLDPENYPSPVEIGVEADGALLWSGPANRIADQRFAGSFKPRCGFRVSVPADLPNGARIRVSEIGSSHALPQGLFRLELGDRFSGRVDGMKLRPNEVELVGWAMDRGRPMDSVAVEVHLRGERLAVATADLQRNDLARAGIGTGRHGFTTRLARLARADLEELDVRVVGTAFQLKLSANHATVSEAETAANEAPLRYDGPVEGRFEQVAGGIARGWARNIEAPHTPVMLEVFIDGLHYATVTCNRFRQDVATARNDHGYHGFDLEIPDALLPVGQSFTIRVAPVSGISKLSVDRHTYRRPGPSNALERSAAADRTERYVYRRPNLPMQRRSAVKCTLVVITQDAAGLIERFLRTFSVHNSHPNYEIVIVDHNSTDHTKEIVRTWADRLHVRLMARGDNYSFSASNNLAAAEHAGDIVLFINNDMEFVGDILPYLVYLMQDPQIGIVGCKLLDHAAGMGPIAPVQHVGVHFGTSDSGLRGFETRIAPKLREIAAATWRVPAVTGAFLAMRREDFERVGGFSETYFYGIEDVDLCLRVQRDLGKMVVCANGLALRHLRGNTRRRSPAPMRRALTANQKAFDKRLGFWLRRRITGAVFGDKDFWCLERARIGFVVSEVGFDATAGDYFTALELGRALAAHHDAEVVFLPRSQTAPDEWYDASGLDVIVVMIDSYDLGKLRGASPTLLTVAWVRNWVERWLQRPWSTEFSLWWAGSALAAAEIEKTVNAPCAVFPIATSWDRFAEASEQPDLRCDYAFTGNFWNAPREITYYLDPDTIPYSFRVFGAGWEAHPRFAAHAFGPVPYARMPEVYRSTRVVVDDANHVTKPFGLVNSRVFDAIAGGALPITNGVVGAQELFGDLLPTYSNAQELDDAIMFFLEHEDERAERVAQLQAIVHEKHRYEARARSAVELISAANRRMRLAIKVGVPAFAQRDEWGDWHFAMALKRALSEHGFTVRIDCIDRWMRSSAAGDDVVLVLRGLSGYEPRADQINVMWNISHPDVVAPAEYEKFDHVFVASTPHAERLRDILRVPIEPLLQCTDPARFYPDRRPAAPGHAVLFVGNSRNELRRSVKAAIDAGLPISVFGRGWSGLIPGHLIKGEHIPNDELRSHYASADIVLNDHWDSMRTTGFISNRVFDALACGARLVSDEVPGLAGLFAGAVETFTSADDLKSIIQKTREEAPKQRKRRLELAAKIADEHSFGNRAGRIAQVVHKLAEERMHAC